MLVLDTRCGYNTIWNLDFVSSTLRRASEPLEQLFSLPCPSVQWEVGLGWRAVMSANQHALASTEHEVGGYIRHPNDQP